MAIRFLFLACIVAACSSAFAQKQNTYYYQNNGKRLIAPDSADYIRIVSEPDAGSALYNIKEFYRGGRIKLIGKTAYVEPVKYEGMVHSYFENGTTDAVISYSNGFITDSAFYKHPNGKLYMVTYHPPLKKMQLPALADEYIARQYDTLGHATISNGQGVYQGYNKMHTYIIETGPVKDGKKAGTWKGTALGGSLSYTEQYKANEITAGTAVDTNGKTYTYTKTRETGPTINGSINNFYDFVAKTFRYPAVARQNHIQGRVVVQFRVNEAGLLSNLSLMQEAHPSLNDEVMRVVPLSPKWMPATVCGYPIAKYLTLPISFILPDR